MYLKSIYINGFKSFGQKTKLDFKTKISGIVGPNGSGKSNTAEAFRFVLGEQSMKNMRGKKGSDLIFSGKKGGLNRASVKVVFDNSDKTLDIDYDEVIIERVVFKDGTGEYLINGNKVRSKDVVELLGSANIGSSGHHIISQGEADKILSISPKERKQIIEEALGLKAFVMKKTEAEKKLEKTEENIKEIKTRQRVNAPRLRFLEKEVEKVKRVENLREELFRLYNLFFPKKAKVAKQILNLKLLVSAKEEEKQEIEEKIKSKRQELENVKNSNETDKERNQKVEAVKAELHKVTEERNFLQKQILKNELEIENQKQKKNAFERQKERTEENLAHYKKEEKNILRIVHKFWQKWTKEILETENISEERKRKWQLYFKDFDELSEEQQNQKVDLAKEILQYFGITKLGQIKPDFDQNFIDTKTEENKTLLKKIKNLDEVAESLSKKIRILNSNSEDAEEVFSQELEIEILKLEKLLSLSLSDISKLMSEKNILEKQLEDFKKEESYAVSIFGSEKTQAFFQNEIFNSQEQNILEKILRTRILLENSGFVDSEKVVGEFEELKKMQDFIVGELQDLNETKEKLNILIQDVTNEIEKKFRTGVEKINNEFSAFFQTLFSGGKGEIFLVNIPIKNPDSTVEEFELGLDVKVSLPNKKITGLGMLSGGERSLTSIALLFAMSSITPPPFIILDETDAALDEANSKRYGDMIEKLAEHSQLILITHNRETMSRAGILYGVTMGSDGVSRLLSISFEEAQKVAK